MKKVLLVILDGWGIAKNKKVSAIDIAKKPFFDNLIKNYPNSKLEASGNYVGLPKGQMGNSEVGHTVLGAGRVINQPLVKIDKSIESNDFYNEKKLLELLRYVKKENKNLHLLGLVSDGGIHSHINHLKAILNLSKKENLNNVFIHCFTDGRDCKVDTAINFIKEIENYTKITTGKIASISGRYFSMDRDNRWERIEKSYKAILGESRTNLSPIELIEKSYNENIFDEFIEPKNFGNYNFNQEDGAIFFNFRSDRIKQIFRVFTEKNFKEFQTENLNLKTLTISNYGIDYPNNEILFEKEEINNSLGEVLEKNNKTQIRIAETEKYPHISYFFSGGREKEFKGEKRILCPSPKVATYDLKPEMSADEITNSIIPKIEKRDTDFICLNYANTDMVGHTGKMNSAIKAVEAVDKCLSRLIPSAKENDYSIIILADHGNSDCMINNDNSPNTYHTTQPVPCILIDKNINNINDGSLANIAPTILKLMGVEVPKEMTYKPLI